MEGIPVAEERTSIIKNIRRFIAAASTRLDIKKAVLFGSHASGREREWSDIDLAVISDDFEGMSAKERSHLLSKIAWETGVTEIDALGYTEAEFAIDDALDLVSEIKEHGVVVYEKQD